MVSGLKLTNRTTPMKLFASTHSRTSKLVKEHSPIYDLAAYQTRQRQLKRQRLIKNLVDTTVFISLASFTFSMLFWGV